MKIKYKLLIQRPETHPSIFLALKATLERRWLLSRLYLAPIDYDTQLYYAMNIYCDPIYCVVHCLWLNT
jgi:hypothetical protein